MTLNTGNTDDEQTITQNSLILYNKEILQRLEDKRKPFLDQCKPFEQLQQQFDEAQKRFIRGY